MSTQNQVVDSPGSNPEAILFHQARAGCRKSLNGLMAKHEGLVHAVVRRQGLGELPFDEALQAGRQGLWRAILGYDPDRGVAFSSYAWPSITRAVWDAVKVAERAQAQAVLGQVRLSEPPPASDPALVWEAHTLHSSLHALVARLPQRLHQIITARYGLKGRQARTYRRIGATLGLSGERVRQLHTEALVWLRHPAHSQTLRSLLNRHHLADYQTAHQQAQHWLRRRGGRYGG
jgi:RNA polymerase sigma factor (sigma-70 family)